MKVIDKSTRFMNLSTCISLFHYFTYDPVVSEIQIKSITHKPLIIHTNVTYSSNDRTESLKYLMILQKKVLFYPKLSNCSANAIKISGLMFQKTNWAAI